MNYTITNKYFHSILTIFEHILTILSLLSVFPLNTLKSIFPVLYKVDVNKIMKFVNPEDESNCIHIENTLNYTNYAYTNDPSKNYNFCLISNFYFLPTVLSLAFVISVIFIIAFLEDNDLKINKKTDSALKNAIITFYINFVHVFVKFSGIFVFTILINRIIPLINFANAKNTFGTSNIILLSFISILCVLAFFLMSLFYFYFINNPLPIFFFPYDYINSLDNIIIFIMKFILSLQVCLQDYYNNITMLKSSLIIIIIFYSIYRITVTKIFYMNFISYINIYFFFNAFQIISFSFINYFLNDVLDVSFIVEESCIIFFNFFLLFFIIRKLIIITFTKKTYLYDAYKLLFYIFSPELSPEQKRSLFYQGLIRHQFFCEIKHCSLCQTEFSPHFNLTKDFPKLFKNQYRYKCSKQESQLLKLMIIYLEDDIKLNRISLAMQEILQECGTRMFVHISFFYAYITSKNEKENIINSISKDFVEITDINELIINKLLNLLKKLNNKIVQINEILEDSNFLGENYFMLKHKIEQNYRLKKHHTNENDMIINYNVIKLITNRDIENFTDYAYDFCDNNKLLNNQFTKVSNIIIKYDKDFRFWKIKRVSYQLMLQLNYCNDDILDKNFESLFPSLYHKMITKNFVKNEEHCDFFYMKDNKDLIVPCKINFKFIPNIEGNNITFCSIEFKQIYNNTFYLIINKNLNIVCVSQNFDVLTKINSNLLKSIENFNLNDLFKHLELKLELNEKTTYKFNINRYSKNILKIKRKADLIEIEDINEIKSYFINHLPIVEEECEIECKVMNVINFKYNTFYAIKVTYIDRSNESINSVSILENMELDNYEETNTVSSVNSVSASTISENKFTRALKFIPEFKMTDNVMNNNFLERIVKIITYSNIFFIFLSVIFIIIMLTNINKLSVKFSIIKNIHDLHSKMYNLIINMDNMLQINASPTNYSNLYMSQFQNLYSQNVDTIFINEMKPKVDKLIEQANLFQMLLSTSLDDSYIKQNIQFPVKYMSLNNNGTMSFQNYTFFEAFNIFVNYLYFLPQMNQSQISLNICSFETINDNSWKLLNKDKTTYYNNYTIFIYNVIFNYLPIIDSGFTKMTHDLLELLDNEIYSHEKSLYIFIGSICIGNILYIALSFVSLNNYINRQNICFRFVYSLEKQHNLYLIEKIDLLSKIITNNINPSTTFIDINKKKESYIETINTGNTPIKSKESQILVTKGENKKKLVKRNVINKDYFHDLKNVSYNFELKRVLLYRNVTLTFLYIIFILSLYFYNSYFTDNVYHVIEFNNDFFKLEHAYVNNFIGLQYSVILNSTELRSGNYLNRDFEDTFFLENTQTLYNTLNILAITKNKTKIFDEFYDNFNQFQGKNFCNKLFSFDDAITNNFSNKKEILQFYNYTCNQIEELNSNIDTILSHINILVRNFYSYFINSNRTMEVSKSIIKDKDINKLENIIVLFLRRYFSYLRDIVDSLYQTQIDRFISYHIYLFLSIITFSLISLIVIKRYVLDEIVISINNTRLLLDILKY